MHLLCTFSTCVPMLCKFMTDYLEVVCPGARYASKLEQNSLVRKTDFSTGDS